MTHYNPSLYKIGDIEGLKKDLSGQHIGQSVYFFEELSSTNDTAKKLAKEGALSGSIVIANNQTKGKGSKGRKWISPSGRGLYLSLIFKPILKNFDPFFLTIMSGVCVALTLRESFGIDVQIKWPNDIMVGKKKLAGILTESSFNDKGCPEFFITGIGVNVNTEYHQFSEDVKEIASSIFMEKGEYCPVGDVLVPLLKEVENEYNLLLSGNIQTIKKRWLQVSHTIGKKVMIKGPSEVIKGVAETITDKGFLALRMPDGGIREVFSGETITIKN